jgi:hypothetical protein
MIVFIGSTSFSGSTFLDVMLGNGENCFACGEVHAFFFPTLPHHSAPDYVCGASECEIWAEAKKQGSGNLYSFLYSLGYEHISDSSKNLKWFELQKKNVSKEDLDHTSIMVYKHPANFIYSRFKRGLKINYKIWERYYKKFLKLFKNPLILSYEDLSKNPVTYLSKICDLTDIPYFPGKEKFWEGETHHLFGAASVRLQFYERGGKRFQSLENEMRNRRKGELLSVDKHRTIYHVEEWKQKLPEKYLTLPRKVEDMFSTFEDNKIIV